jgi:hypothetical protein
MLGHLWRCTAGVACAALTAVAALAADPIFLPGSRVGLTPPPGMTMSKTFRGFEDPANRVAIVVSELSAQTYAKIENEFTPEALKAQGMDVQLNGVIELAVGPARFTAVRQQVGGVPTRKWALLVPHTDLTAVVIALVPEAASATYTDGIIRDALASFTLRGRLSDEELLSVLPYAVRDLAGFRVLHTNPDGTAAFTFGPKDTPLPAEQPYFMIATRPGETPSAADQDRFARGVLGTFLGAPDLRVTGSEPLRIAGRHGHEIVAEMRDSQVGVDLMVVQWLRFAGGGFVQLLGIARKDQWADALPRMRALRDGIEGRRAQ